MIRCVPGEVDDAAGELTQLKLFIVAEVYVERLVQQRRIIKPIHWCKELLHLGDSPSDADGYLAAQPGLQILRRGKVVGVRVCLAVDISAS